MSIPMTVAIPVEVVEAPLLATVITSGWRGENDGVPDSVALSWIKDRPIEHVSLALLEYIVPRTLSKDELPDYIKCCDRAETLFAARKDRANLLMAGPDDRHKNFKELETPAHELCAALRNPLGAA